MITDRSNRQPDLESILASEPDAERESLRRAWDALAEYPEDPFYRELWQATVWDSIDAHLSESQPAEPEVVRLRTMTFPRVAAAAVLLAALIGVGIAARPVSYTADRGELLSVTLPDGSSVDMNSGSSISHPRWFLTARNVRLDGEAYFDVVDQSDPFVVETSDARVTVVGTQFNVHARGQTIVSVVSGAVEISPLSAESSMQIEAEEHAIVRGSKVALTDQLDNETALAWRRRDLVFRDARLDVVAAEIERRFAVRIHLSGNELAGRRVTTNLRQPLTVETVVRDLCEALQVRYRHTSDGFELFTEAPT